MIFLWTLMHHLRHPLLIRWLSILLIHWRWPTPLRKRTESSKFHCREDPNPFLSFGASPLYLLAFRNKILFHDQGYRYSILIQKLNPLEPSFQLRMLHCLHQLFFFAAPPADYPYPVPLPLLAEGFPEYVLPDPELAPGYLDVGAATLLPPIM